MNVRDISQYIKALCSEETLSLLGTNKELLLQKIYGQDPSADQVKSVISDAASFASNAEEQLFYEFVQNAYDANADSLFFYANKDYLIVLNNGEPFYTDFDIFDSATIREGQLYNFLAKGKSLKRTDQSKLGKYGQGSKLLYTLLARVSESEENEDLLVETLYNEKKGPYLISWYNRNQLANLLQMIEQTEWEWSHEKGDDYKNNILFAKILMSYYPIAPGRDEKLFSTDEALKAISAFNSLVDPRRNLHFLNRGTALIIPLGAGKYERITAKENIERVKTRLGGFASITKDQERNEGRTIEHIYVFGEEVEQYEVQSVFVEFKVDDKPFHYHFAFNPKFAEKNFVNLFKGLPILETKLRLGFIIDSQKFDVDNSRQRINDKEKTKAQLVRAFSELITELNKLKQTNRKKFDYIYKALIATMYLDGDDSKYIKDSFQEVIIPFLKENVLTVSGEYEMQSKVRVFADDVNIPLEAIGVSSYKWIDDSVKKDLHRHNVDVEVKSLASLLTDANQSMLQEWIKSLTRKEYNVIHKIFDKHKESISTFKLFWTDKGNLYSYNKLKSTANVYYPIEEGMRFGECEHVVEVLGNIEQSGYISNLFEKIKANIDTFRLSDSRKDDAANLLAWIVNKMPNYEGEIKNEVYLLQNRHEEYVSFNDLLAERPNGTILFDNYCVKGYVPYTVNSNNWLLNPLKAKKDCWQWTVRHWQELQEKEEWGENTHRYIRDIKTVYNAGLDLSGNVDSTKLTLYLNEEGKPTSSFCAIVNNISRLTEEEYNYLGAKTPKLKLLPYEFHKELMEAPFNVETIQTANIVKDGLFADKELLRIIIKITDSYLLYYRTQETNGRFHITKTSSGYNYIDSVSPDLLVELSKANIYRIPDYVQELLSTEKAKYKFASNEPLLIKAIEGVSNPIKLLPFVKEANAKVVDAFFNKLGLIDVDQKIDKSDLKWQVIEFAVSRSNEGKDYTKIVFDNIRHNGNELPISITKQFVNIGENEYDVYLLNEQYKDDNQTIDSFFGCLPSQKEVDYFKEYYYQDKEDEISVETLYEELHNKCLTIEQLRYCLDYSIAYNVDDGELEIAEDWSVTDALDMILRNNFVGFDRFFKMPNVDLNIQVYASHDILLEEEYLPENIHAWIDMHPEVLRLFTKLQTISNQFYATRQALLNEVYYSELLDFECIDNKDEIDRTINWAIGKNLCYEYASERYKLMMAIIEKLPSDYTIMPFLKYTGKVSCKEDGVPRPLFSLERCQEECSFLSTRSWNAQFEYRLHKSSKLANFIKSNTVYVYNENEVLVSHGFAKYPRWNVLTAVDVKDFPEYSDPVYELWKKTSESKGITIHISDKPIVMKFNIMSSNSSVFADKMHDSEYGYEYGKRVIIQHPNDEGLSLMKSIAKHIKGMDFFKEPFIALQALYVEKWEELQGNLDNDTRGNTNIDLSNCDLTEEAAQETLNKISSETAENLDALNEITKQIGSKDLGKLNEVAEPIKELINTFDKEELKILAEKKGKIMQMINDLDEAEEEEKKSQVRQTIGFIGELIYSHYLKNKRKEFIHAALDGVGEYDFEIKDDDMFVDVKTTLYSLKDGTAPFYLHRSQNNFLQKHPDSKYHIVRISLTDLNLKKSYEELREKYGMNANPLKNSQLRKRCEAIAKKYWRAAKINEFDALSPEYAIRREQKNNKKRF